MSKGARNRRIKMWVGGNRRLARKLRRVIGWNGKMPGYGFKSKQPLKIPDRPLKSK